MAESTAVYGAIVGTVALGIGLAQFLSERIDARRRLAIQNHPLVYEMLWMDGRDLPDYYLILGDVAVTNPASRGNSVIRARLTSRHPILIEPGKVEIHRDGSRWLAGKNEPLPDDCVSLPLNVPSGQTVRATLAFVIKSNLLVSKGTILNDFWMDAVFHDHFMAEFEFEDMYGNKDRAVQFAGFADPKPRKVRRRASTGKKAAKNPAAPKETGGAKTEQGVTHKTSTRTHETST